MAYKIVLTADRTLMSEYNKSEFIGFAACSPKLIPEWLYTRIFCPSVESDDGIVERAPCGTRKIEASLLNNGFSEDEVAVAHPEHLDKVISEDTKALGITSNDPLGLGPASSTFSSLIGRETYTAIFFRKIVTNPLIRKYGVKVIVGGPGAWQLDDKRIRTKFGIDCVAIGEGENAAPGLFRKVLSNASLPSVVHGDVVPLEHIPNIKGATVNGLVEIARGCGRGCKFCNPTMLKFRCRPLSEILKEVKINLAYADKIILHAEDVLRYKANGPIPNEEEVMKLFIEVKKLTNNLGMSHFALASVLSKPKLVENISEVLELGSKARPWVAGQTGVETGSPHLATEHLKGKAKPFKVEEWPDIVRQSFKVLKDNNWVPCATLISGLPKETADDVIKTIELLDDVSSYKSLIVPLFFVPIGILDDAEFFRAEDMYPEHWQLLAACIHHDFHWAYELIDDISRLDKMQIWKTSTLKLVAHYMEKKIKPYVMSMEQGENPLRK